MSSYELPILKPKAAPPEPKQRTTYPQEVQRDEEPESEAAEPTFGSPRAVLDMFAARDAFLAKHLGPKQPLQTALEVSEPGDELEEEAEKVADHVMRMAEPTAGAGDDEEEEKGTAGMVQRACATCEEEEDDDEKKMVQRDAEAAAPPVGAGFEAGLRASRAGGGEALPDGVRAFMEPRFGKDFGDVRVHRDAEASELTEEVRAKAFTVGSDVFFREGHFEPRTETGQRLIAHELSHVVQQREGMRSVQREILQRDKRDAAAPRSASSTKLFRQAEAPRAASTEPAVDNVCTIEDKEAAVVADDNTRKSLKPGSKVKVLVPKHRRDPRWARVQVLEAAAGSQAKAGTEALIQRVFLKHCEAPAAPRLDLPSASERSTERLPSGETVIGFEAGPAGELVHTAVQGRANYVDQRVEAVGVGLLLGGYLLFVRGLDQPVFLPNSYVNLLAHEATAVDETIHPDRETALKSLADARRQFAYYDIVGEMIAPTAFSRASTPRIARMIEDGQKQLAREAQEALTYLAVSIVGGVVLRLIINKIIGVSAQGTDKWRAKQEKIRAEIDEQARPPARPPPTQALATEPRQGQPSPAPQAPALPSGEVTVPVLGRPSGSGIQYGSSLADDLQAAGKSGPAILKPLVENLNAQGSMTVSEKARAAWAAADKQNSFTGGTWGPGPLARMPNGDFVVSSRAPLNNAPVIIIKADGRVLVGRADLKLVNNKTSMHISNVKE